MPNYSSGHVVTNTEFNLVTPVGVVLPYAATSAPSSWFICDGSAVSRATYSDLFTAIGTTFGVGDGSTTFNLPDLRGRMIVGYAPSGGHTDVSTLAANDGQAVANRRPKHRTTNSLTVSPSTHSHQQTMYSGPGGSTVAGTASGASSSTGNGDSTAGTSLSIGGSVGTNNANDALDTPSYIVLNYIIKT